MSEWTEGRVDCRAEEWARHAAEMRRLEACYELASADDRKVVWAALNKYAPLLDAGRDAR